MDHIEYRFYCYCVDILLFKIKIKIKGQNHKINNLIGILKEKYIYSKIVNLISVGETKQIVCCLARLYTKTGKILHFIRYTELQYSGASR